MGKSDTINNILIDPYFEKIKDELLIMYIGAIHDKKIVKTFKIDYDTYYQYRYLLSSEYGKNILKKRMLSNDILYYRKHGYTDEQIARKTRQDVAIVSGWDNEIFIPLKKLLTEKTSKMKKIKVKATKVNKVPVQLKQSKVPVQLKQSKICVRSKSSIPPKIKKTLTERLAEIDSKESALSDNDIKGSDSLFCDTEFLEQFFGRKLDKRECE